MNRKLAIPVIVIVVTAVISVVVILMTHGHAASPSIPARSNVLYGMTPSGQEFMQWDNPQGDLCTQNLPAGQVSCETQVQIDSQY